MPISSILYQSGKWWIAHSKIFDLVTQGRTPGEAMRNLQDIMDIYIDFDLERYPKGVNHAEH